MSRPEVSTVHPNSKPLVRTDRCLSKELRWLLVGFVSVVMAAQAACSTTPSALVDEGIAIERPYLLARRQLPRAQRDLAADAYEQACRSGFESACMLFERLMVARGRSVREFLAGHAEYAKDCDDGDGKACFRLGLLLDNDSGLGIEAERSLGLYQRGCGLGYDYACQRAAQLHVVLFDYPASNVEIRRLTRRSCRAGYGEACKVDADLAKLGRGGPRDLVLSRELLGKACRRGQSNACVRLAKWHAFRKEPVAAKQMLAQLVEPAMGLCERGHTFACLVVLGLAREPRANSASLKDSMVRACLKGGVLEVCLLMSKLRAVPMPKHVEAKQGRLYEAELASILTKIQALQVERLTALKQTQPHARNAAQERDFWRRYYERRCFREGQLAGCNRLAGWQKTHRSLAAQAQRQAQSLVQEMMKQRQTTYTRGCQDDDAFACFQLANTIEASVQPSAEREARVAQLRAKARRLEAKIRAAWKRAPSTAPGTP